MGFTPDKDTRKGKYIRKGKKKAINGGAKGKWKREVGPEEWIVSRREE